MAPRVVALLDPDRTARIVPADAPAVSAIDLGATRGDGIFETISVGRGRPQALEAHLDRFAHSARMLDLPEPDRAAWAAAIRTVVDALPPAEEAFVKTVLTRGIEGGDAPTGWLVAEHAPDHSAVRRDGVRVVLLERGTVSLLPARAPWLLLGAKTLSYAVNRAAIREAHRRGADDVVFVSTDGLLLEGPSSTLIVRTGDRLVTPPTAFGVLAGTTQGDLFRFAEASGLVTAVESLTPADLLDADAAWLVSSVRHAAPVRGVDGEPLRIDAELSAAMNAFLLARTD